MIPVNELRIGNWVEVKHTDETTSHQQVTEIKRNGVKTTGLEVWSINGCIALTPAVLERCGFVTITTNEDGDKNYWSKELDASIDIEFDISDNGVEANFYYRVHETKRRKRIEYLHQLQNLFFSLAGHELNYKPE